MHLLASPMQSPKDLLKGAVSHYLKCCLEQGYNQLSHRIPQLLSCSAMVIFAQLATCQACTLSLEFNNQVGSFLSTTTVKECHGKILPIIKLTPEQTHQKVH